MGDSNRVLGVVLGQNSLRASSAAHIRVSNRVIVSHSLRLMNDAIVTATIVISGLRSQAA